MSDCCCFTVFFVLFSIPEFKLSNFLCTHASQFVVFHFVPVSLHLDLASEVSGRWSVVAAEVFYEVRAVNLIKCGSLGGDLDSPRVWVVFKS